MPDTNIQKSSLEPQATFEVTTVPIGEFNNYTAVPADEEAAKVVELLAQLGAEEVEREALPDGQTHQAVHELLTDWARYTRRTNGVLYWVGHGEAISETDAWLAVRDTESPMSGGKGINPTTLADYIKAHWIRRRDDGTWAMVVIEACGAEVFVDGLNASLRPAPKRLVLFGAGGQGENYLGSFSNALVAALGSYTDNDTEIRLDDLMQRVYGRLTESTLHLTNLVPVPSFPRSQVLPGGVTATVDVYAELQSVLRSLPDDERGHFVPKAQGAEQGELAWYFTGRMRERQEICDWLHTQRNGMLVVTGRAGCGKSALLGNVLVYSNAELRTLLVNHHYIEDLGEHQRPPDEAFTEVVNLSGLTTADLVKRLLWVVGNQPLAATLNESLELLIVLLHDRKQPFTLLADALDESQEPTSIASLVLQRIASQPACRVIVGTRKSTHEGPDQPDTTDENLLDALGRGESTRVMEVLRDPSAIGQYVSRRLDAAQRMGTLPKTASVRDIAQLIQDQPSRQFLYARLAVHEILAQPELVLDENRGRLNELLAHDHRRLFAQAVERLATLNPLNPFLLEALALAIGRGLPRADGIWAIVADALMDGNIASHQAVSEADIDQIIQVAAPYIMLDAEDGQSVYRLAHRTFQEHFLIGTGQ